MAAPRWKYWYDGLEGPTDEVEVRSDGLTVFGHVPGDPLEGIRGEQARRLLERFRPVLRLVSHGAVALQGPPGAQGAALAAALRAALADEAVVRRTDVLLHDAADGNPRLAVGQLYLVLRTARDAKRVRSLAEDLGVAVRRGFPWKKGAYLVAGPSEDAEQTFAQAAALLARSEVLYCHPVMAAESVPHAIDPWHLGPGTGGGLNALAAPTKGAAVTIAVVDEEIDTDHVEFQGTGKVVHPVDATTITRPDGTPGVPVADARAALASEMHGTPCAGMATAGGLALRGVAPGAALLPIRLPGTRTDLQEADAYAWAVAKGADVISRSWGAYRVKGCVPRSIRDALETAARDGRGGLGCVLCFSAGNDSIASALSQNPYGSRVPAVFVGASNSKGRRAAYSNGGRQLWCLAPSGEIGAKFAWSTDRSGQAGRNAGGAGAPGTQDGDYLEFYGGTSWACAAAAGVAALVIAANPALTGREVRVILALTAEKIDAAAALYDAGGGGHSLTHGYGRLDADKAVQRAVAPAPPGGFAVP